MKLAVIIGSTRQGRITDRLAKWVKNQANEQGIETEIIDLRDYPMPFFDEPISPRYNPSRQIDPRAKKWLTKLESFSSYVFVTAEYNHSIPGVLKNALDYVTWEMQRKPVLVMSQGSAGGARAATDLKEILNESRAVVLPTMTPLTIVGASDKFSEDGQLLETELTNPRGSLPALKSALQELGWFDQALTSQHTNIASGLESA